MGELKAKCVLYFPYRSKCAVLKIQYGGWQTQYDGESKRCQKSRDYHRPCKQYISKQRNVVLDVS